MTTPLCSRTDSPALAVQFIGTAEFCLTPANITYSAFGSPYSFALLFRLSVTPDVPVSRTELITFVYRDVTDATRNSFRALLSALKRAGVPLVATRTTVLMPTWAIQCQPIKPAGELFGGWTGAEISHACEMLVDQQRAVWDAQAIKPRLTKLVQAKQDGRWHDVPALAREIVAFDPLNEAGNLALVETMAVAGDKVGALHLVDSYAARVGDEDSALRVPIRLLRRRIEALHAERAPSDDDRSVPLLEREDLCAEIARWLSAVHQPGMPRAFGIVSPPGMGKSSVLRRMRAHAVLHGWQVHAVRAREAEASLRFNLLLQVLPHIIALRSAPGGAGIDHASTEVLEEVLAGVPARPLKELHVQYTVAHAIAEHLIAVAYEQPLLITVDDAQWIDAESLRVIGRAMSETRRQEPAAATKIAWLLASRVAFADVLRPEQIATLEPLSPEARWQLFRHLHPPALPREVHAEVEQALAATSGHPMLVSAVARHVAHDGHADAAAVAGTPSDAVRTSLRAEVTRLDPLVRELLQDVALLGSLATTTRLRQLWSERVQSMAATLGDAERGGLLWASDAGALGIHALWAEALLAEMTVLQRQARHREILEGLLRELPPPAQQFSHCWHVVFHGQQAGAMGPTARAVLDLTARSVLPTTDALALLESVFRAPDITPDHLAIVAEQMVDLLQFESRTEELDRLEPVLHARLDEAGIRATLVDTTLALHHAHSLGTFPDVITQELVRIAHDATRPIPSRLLACSHLTTGRAAGRVQVEPALLSELLRAIAPLTPTRLWLKCQLLDAVHRYDTTTTRETIRAFDGFVRLHSDLDGRGVSRVWHWCANALGTIGDGRAAMRYRIAAIEEALSVGVPYAGMLASHQALSGLLLDLGLRREFLTVHAAYQQLLAMTRADNFPPDVTALHADACIVRGDRAAAAEMLEIMLDPDTAASAPAPPALAPTARTLTLAAWLHTRDSRLTQLAEQFTTAVHAWLPGHGVHAHTLRESSAVRLAIALSAIGAGKEAQSVLSTHLAYRGGAPTLSPVDALRARIAERPGPDVIAWFLCDRPPGHLEALTGLTVLPEQLTAPLRYLRPSPTP